MFFFHLLSIVHRVRNVFFTVMERWSYLNRGELSLRGHKHHSVDKIASKASCPTRASVTTSNLIYLSNLCSFISILHIFIEFIIIFAFIYRISRLHITNLCRIFRVHLFVEFSVCSFISRLHPITTVTNNFQKSSQATHIPHK